MPNFPSWKNYRWGKLIDQSTENSKLKLEMTWKKSISQRQRINYSIYRNSHMEITDEIVSSSIVKV